MSETFWAFFKRLKSFKLVFFSFNNISIVIMKDFTALCICIFRSSLWDKCLLEFSFLTHLLLFLLYWRHCFQGRHWQSFQCFNNIKYITVYLQEPTFHFKPQQYQKSILKRLHFFSFMYLKLSMCAVWFINNSLNKNSIWWGKWPLNGPTYSWMGKKSLYQII